MLSVRCCVLCVVACGSVCVFCRLLFVLFDCCLLCVVSCMPFVVRCMMFVVGNVLCVA